MMKTVDYLISLCTLVLLGACGQSSIETTFASQSDKIDTYVSNQLTNHPEYLAVYDQGVVRLIVAEGEGAEAVKGGKVTFYYAAYNFNNTSISAGSLIATNDADIAAAANWPLSDTTLFVPATVTLGKDKLIPGLEIGLTGVKPGEDSYILFSGIHGFGKRQIGTIPANAAICYHVRIEDTEN
ncbi:MAG: FKBP-type peptidyl-prolyl cis-trans isomerase [Bacteroidales bacterium]|nr:FKBP-type peptidyl-prolyl cis-trans isomerase [Bacteroidales bacterium]